jgi:hypothetical protein
MTQLESVRAASVDQSENFAHAGLGKNISVEDVRFINQLRSHELPKGFAAATVDGDGSLHLGDKIENAADLHSPKPIPDGDLNQLANRIKQSPHLVTKDVPGGGKLYADDQGNALIEYPDGRKAYATDHGQHVYETNPDGSWKESFSVDGHKTIVQMNADGSGKTTDTKGDETTTTVWGPGGAFQQETRFNNKTGVGTITKPGPDGELVTTPITSA